VSTPVRRLATPPPAQVPRGGREPGVMRPRPRARPARARRTAPIRRRRRHHLGFTVFAGVLVGALVLGIVILNVLLAQQSFRLVEAERRIEALGREHLELVREQATLSAPGRIAAWASRHGMRLPDDIRILRAPNGPADPTGADPSDLPVGDGR
jgi:hypothetical protein